MSEFRRQHPVAAVTQLLAVIRQNLVTIFILLFVGSQNTNESFWIIFWVGLFAAFSLGIVGWYRFTFRVDENELQIKKGIFVRKNLYLSKERIQVIDITEGLLQRMFGLVKVEVKSAGGGTEKATISAISRADAEQMRALLRAESPSDAPALSFHEDSVQKVDTNPVWEFSRRDLLFAALTSGNFGLIASILGAISGQLDQFITEENLEYVIGLLPGISRWSVVLWGVLFVLLVSYVISFIGVILRYTDFKIEKKEKELVISSGLIERKYITLPFDRIQAIRFVEGITRQPFGYGMLYVESAGFEQKDQDRSIVLVPFLKKNRLEDFFSRFLEVFPPPERIITPPKRSLLRYVRRPNYLLILGIPLLWLFWSNAWVLFLLMIPFSLFGWLEYKDAAIFKSKEAVIFQFRTLAKTTAFVKRNRIQIAEITENPLQKRKQLASIHITVASGAGGRTFSMDDIEEADAQYVFDWVLKPTSIEVLKLNEHHMGQVKELLSDHALPIADVDNGNTVFWGSFHAGTLAGCIGLEKHGSFGLLRSLAVKHSEQGAGIGTKLVHTLEKEALREGVQELYLLTNAAEEFFKKHGYETIDRSQVPPLIQQTSEFSVVCPDTAIVMKKIV